MAKLTPFRCDRCDSLGYEPEDSIYKWKFDNHVETDLCIHCNDVMSDYFFLGIISKLNLGCEGTMENEKRFIDDVKESLKEIGD